MWTLEHHSELWTCEMRQSKNKPRKKGRMSDAIIERGERREWGFVCELEVLNWGFRMGKQFIIYYYRIEEELRRIENNIKEHRIY
jgi:hypothetical protein